MRALDGAGEDLFTELSAMFLDRSHALLAKLRQGFATGDHAAIMQCAHSLGGGASNVGAQRMSRLSKQIELLTSRGKILDSREKMAELETEFQLVEKELARIAELPPGPE
ncbi:MAG: Hpt domain-containing protein [Acidobacteriota bacterium]